MIVSTHPDMDHIGGLIPIVEQMPVSLVLDSGKHIVHLLIIRIEITLKKGAFLSFQ